MLSDKKASFKSYYGVIRSGVPSRHHEDRLREYDNLTRLASGFTVHLAKARVSGNTNPCQFLSEPVKQVLLDLA